MTTEVKNASEDTEMADCDGEKVVTMMDVLQEQEDFEEDVNAVLGASDEKDCTYSKGYIKRQALYACMTCCSDAKNDPTKRAGVCLACSLTCHENHDLIELYTKRNFKCDCGNPKFNSHPCQFTPDKTDLNEENNYNQNFSGLYCVCQRPYPDPESPTDVEMIQCIICEDWLHASHLEATVPDNDQYSEMICKGCMEKNEFLHDYGNLAVNIDVDVVTNGIDNDKICNGDAELETSIKDETVKATNENAENKVSDNTEENSEKTNGDDSEELSSEKKDEENSVDTNAENKVSDNTEENSEITNGDDSEELSSEKKDEENSVDTPMETEESKQLDPNYISETPTEDVTKDATVDENTTTENEIDGETVNQEQQNEKQVLASDPEQTESATEQENTESIEKSAEQIEEERLLADPDDESKKAKAEEKGDIKKDESGETTVTDTSDTTQVTNENVADKTDDEPISDDKQNESRDNKVSTEIEKPVDEGSAENTNETNSSPDDKAVNSEENASKTNEDNDAVESKETVSQNGDAEDVKISEKRKLSTEDNTGSDIKKAKFEETNESCVRPKGVQKVHKGATFWPSTFRQKLCTCRECITMYNDLSVLFLTDPEDTVTAYENLGKQKINGKPASQYEKGLQALSSLDRIQQINALTEYNKMRDKLLDFLKSFKDRREVVKEEDIKEFFAGMKPKREPDGVYFCR